VPQPSAFEAEMAIDKLKQIKRQVLTESPQNWLKQGLEQFATEILKLIHSIWNKEELPEEWKDSINVHTYKKVIQENVVILEAYHFCQAHTKFYLTSFCQG